VPKGRFATLTSWSFSVYTQYMKCPFSVCLDKIMRVRIQEPDNPHFIKGNRTHTIADTFIGGVGAKRPALEETIKCGKETLKVNLTAVKDQLIDLRKKKARTEQEWAFDRQWKPTDWRDWTGAWLRIKTDVCADTKEPPTVEIVDWKTGKPYADHKQQRSLYALGGLQLVQIGALADGNKDVKLTARHVYIDTGQSATEEFTMKNLAPLKREWLARIKIMMSDTTFKTKTGRHCGYCKYAKSKGGPCPEKM
jgi:hypothetical protein